MIKLKLFLVFIIVILFISCSNKKDIQQKPYVIEGLYELNDFLLERIYEIAIEDYYKKYKNSNDTIERLKSKTALKLFLITEKIDSLSSKLTYDAKTKVIDNSTLLDTISFTSFIKNSYFFNKEVIFDSEFRRLYKMIDSLLIETRKIKRKIENTQTGHGCIKCRGVHENSDFGEYEIIDSYWDLFFRIECDKYLIYKEILCSYTNLSSLYDDLPYVYNTKYDSEYPKSE